MCESDCLVARRVAFRRIAILVPIAFLLAQPLALLIQAAPLSTEGFGEIPGGQAFPPATLTHESNASALSSWIAARIGLPTLPLIRTSTQVTMFLDGFHRDVLMTSALHEYTDSSTATLRVYYESSSGEFAAFEVQMLAPFSTGSLDLRNFSASLGSRLSMPLNISSYRETTSGEKRNANGTGVVPITRTGDWVTMSGTVEINFANQIRVVEDGESHAVLQIRGFRWVAMSPSLGFPPEDVVTAASEIVNTTYEDEGALSSSSIGLIPDYGNLTWSILVDLIYRGPDGRSDRFVLLLRAETLELRWIIMRVTLVPSRPGGALAYIVPALAIIAVLSFCAFLGAAWLSHIDANWVLAGTWILLPFYVRLRKESVLDHFLRGRIVEFVAANPGISFTDLRKRFAVANGVLSYHIWVLSKMGFIATDRDGKSTRLYPPGSRDRPSIIVSPFQLTLLRAVSERRDVKLYVLAQELRSSRQRTHYNVKHLVALGLLEVHRDGGGRTIWLSQKGTAFLAEGTPTGASDSASVTYTTHEPQES